MNTMAAAFQNGASSGASAQSATAASILSGTSQALGGLMRQRAQEREAAAAESQAELSDIRAEREMLRGKQEANSIRGELLRNLASQQAAAGASGLAQGSGVIQTGMDASVEAGQREIRIARGNARTRATGRRLRGFRLRREAAFRRQAGQSELTQGLLSGASSILQRGFAPSTDSPGATTHDQQRLRMMGDGS